MAAIGIDLGTTFSCVAICKNGIVQIIPNEHEKRLTPAYVAFTEEERLFGDSAKHQAPLNLANTVYNIKHIIGRLYNDQKLKQDKKYLGYTIEPDRNGYCQIPISSYGKQVELYPEQITAMTIVKMKDIAKAHVEETVSRAVISVPGFFNEAQRQATINAGRMAGLEDVKLITEPMASALAYGHDKQLKTIENILIFDCGGGTTEISLAKITSKDVKIISTFGENFGGDDFDNRLVLKYGKDLGIEIHDKKAITRLRNACEKAKQSLSAASRARIKVDNLYNNEPFESTITREDFDKINEELFEKVTSIVQKMSKFLTKNRHKVDEIILIGGSTRIPNIRNILQNSFNVKHLNRTINPDEAVAYGAAVHAANEFTNCKKIVQVREMTALNNSNTVPENKKRKIEETSQAKLTEMTQKVLEFDKHDEMLREESNARNNLEKYAYSTKKKVHTDKYKDKLSAEDKKGIFHECDLAITWLETNKRKKVVEKKLEELKQYCEAIFDGKSATKQVVMRSPYVRSEKSPKGIVTGKMQFYYEFGDGLC
ncbi:heat shock 70 kDa protein-like [Styela clava]